MQTAKATYRLGQRGRFQLYHEEYDILVTGKGFERNAVRPMCYTIVILGPLVIHLRDVATARRSISITWMGRYWLQREI